MSGDKGVAIVLLGLCTAATISHAQRQRRQKGPTPGLHQVCHGSEAAEMPGRPRPAREEADEVLGIVREGIGQMPPISAERAATRTSSALSNIEGL
jgi:hypothetical protein